MLVTSCSVISEQAALPAAAGTATLGWAGEPTAPVGWPMLPARELVTVLGTWLAGVLARVGELLLPQAASTRHPARPDAVAAMTRRCPYVMTFSLPL